MLTTPRACSRAAAAAAGLLLLAACSQTSAAPSSSSTAAPVTTKGTPGSPTTAAAPAVTKPAADEFQVCDSRHTATDAAGKSYCTTTAHETPLGAAKLTCLANLTTVPAAQARLKVTYSVFMEGRNIAYFRDIAPSKYTVKDFQVRYDFTPTDAKWWGVKTLPPGSYYCEWYDPKETKLGEKDIVHGTLPSSTVGTPGAAI